MMKVSRSNPERVLEELVSLKGGLRLLWSLRRNRQISMAAEGGLGGE